MLMTNLPGIFLVRSNSRYLALQVHRLCIYRECTGAETLVHQV